MAYVSGSHSSALSFGDRLAEIKTQLVEAYTAHKLYRRTMTELERCSDRELNDLGLSRSMIKSVALEAAYGKAKR
ncbi:MULTISPECIES: DUF1127 domain-containing protein [Paracoccaceae]|jgi:uncharacterized protein YjiS (DUF1127 family)|uniref:DUF1127 domain-containing protein n=1 Tax=Rhodophyticola porphyridii TaxID=1852017 RepID=A0A3L9Y7P5_9RHOB|nr:MULTISPECIES: DUF1127 domain-containing protein [Paracoccaceae]MBO6602646.1 DUF1127 domain-containing protein [Roseicyclus sp.]MBO6922796.1 DUF1127 domain-containing protein [Roseicyclus sp.]RMA43107.1 DUF1127 domain-containing protein [Rhodophyticola porphyridii]